MDTAQGWHAGSLPEMQEPILEQAEEWKTVAGWENYEASNFGRVRSHYRGTRIIKPFVTKWGYQMISLWRNNRDTKMTVHSLVALLFIGPRPAGLDVHHKNGIKTDNRAVNLCYVTRGENIKHAWDNNLRQGLLGLCPNEIREIRRRYALGERQRMIARDFGMCRENVSAIVCRKSHAAVQDETEG